MTIGADITNFEMDLVESHGKYEMVESKEYSTESSIPSTSSLEYNSVAMEIQKPHEVPKVSDNLVTKYFKKFLGVEGKSSPPHTESYEMVISSVLAFVGILLVSIVDWYFLASEFEVDNIGIKMLTGAYAATSVLIYEAYKAPLAQPRNVLGGYLVASFLGVSTRLVCDKAAVPRFVTGPLAVAIGLLGMNVTKTVHPPGGACALIAVIGGPMVESLGYGYVATSFGAAFIMLAVAVLGNNLFPTRQYPVYWW